MTVTIFGATGMVGKQLVHFCLHNGYRVNAYGRNVHELIEDAERNEHLSLIKGGLFDKSDVEKAVKSADFVLSALGGAIDGSDHTRSLGMKYIVEAMEKKNVKRIVAIGGIGCLQADDNTLLYETDSFPEQYKMVTEEHLKAYDYLKNSGLDWTFVCPPLITEAEPTGHYDTSINYPAKGNTIRSGDLAQFMIQEANQLKFPKLKVGIAQY